MEWPESVHVDTLGFKKQNLKGRPRKEGQNRYTAGQQEETRRLRESCPFVPSGVTLHAGSRGATSLEAVRADEENRKRRSRRGGQDAPRKRWNWQFANIQSLGECKNERTLDDSLYSAALDSSDHRLQVGEDFAEFFPPTIHVNEDRQETGLVSVSALLIS